MIETQKLHKALGFRTLWKLEDLMASFRRIASESALGTGRLNGVLQLTKELQKVNEVKKRAVLCFSNNKYITNFQKWSFNNVKDTQVIHIFDGSAVTPNVMICFLRVVSGAALFVGKRKRIDKRD